MQHTAGGIPNSPSSTSLSAGKYQSLFENMDQAFCIIEVIFDHKGIGVDYIFLEYNKRFALHSGLDNVTGKSARQLVPGLESHWPQVYGEVVKSGNPVREVEYSSAMNRWFDVSAYRLGDDTSAQVAVLFTDITDRKRSEEALQESEARFQNLVRDSHAAIIVLLGKELIVSIVNEAYGNLIGLSSEDLRGKPLFSVIPQAEEYYRPLLEQVLTTGKTIQLHDSPYEVTTNGQRYKGYLNVVYQPYRNSEKEIVGVMAILQDVTESVHTRLALKASESRFRAIIEEAPIATCLFVGPDMRIELANDIMIGYWGKGYEVLGKPLVQALPELENQPFLEILRKVYLSGETFEATAMPANLVVNGIEGTYYFDFTYKAMRDETGKIYGVLDMAVDVTDQVLARQRLESSEKKYRHLVETNIIGILFWNLDVGIMEANDSFLNMLGYSRSEFGDGLHWSEITPDVWADRDEESVREVLDNGYSLPFEKQYIHKDGSLIDVIIASSAFDGTGNKEGVTYVVNISDRKRMEFELRESEERFRSIANDTPAFIFMADEKTNVDFLNRQWLNFVGQDFEQAKGLAWAEITHPDDLSGMMDVYVDAVATYKPYQFEIRQMGADGQYHNVLWNGVPRIGVDGRFRGMLGVGIDVSQSRAAVEKLRESEERFRSLIERAPVATCLFVGQELVIEVANEKMIQFMGKGESVIGMRLEDALPELSSQGFIEILSEVYRTGKLYEARAVPAIISNRNGSDEIRYYDFTFKPLMDGSGQVYAIIDMSVDVTEQVISFKQLEESQALFRTMADQSPVFVFILATGEGVPVSFFNKRWLEYTGQTLEEALGTAWADVVHPDDVQITLDFIEPAFKEQRDYEIPAIRVRRYDGVYRWFSFKGSPRLLPDGTFIGYVGVGYDIHMQVEAREALKESEAQLRQLSDFMPQIVWAARPDGYHDFYNRQWFEFTDLTVEESRADGWTKVLHSNDLEKAKLSWQRSLQTGELYEIEYRMRRKDGEYRWHLARAMPFRNTKGSIIRWLGTCTDIHDQKNSAHKLEEMVAERTRELIRSNEDLQQFAHVASHDLKEPVRKIRLFAGRLMEELGYDLKSQLVEFVKKIEISADRMQAMIDGILKYSSVDAAQSSFEHFELEDLVAQLKEDLEVPIEAKSAIIEYNELPRIYGSKLLIYQVLYNLVSNSLKFSRDGVRPMVRISAKDISQADENGATNGYKEITVEDNGIGFDQVNAEHIFRTFTRLHSKDQYEGTGLGLSFCRKIVERHGGRIEANGIQGQGAKFIIRLPA